MAARAIVDRGHEVCSHGLRWIEHYTLTKDEERDQINEAVKIIKSITGERPLGWYCREPSPNTIELLSEEGGFLYDSDVYNDDLPYYVDVKEKKFLLIPYTPDANDFHYLSNRFANSEEFFQYLKDSFDYTLQESRINGKMMSVGLHVRMSGRAGRTVALEKFFAYIQQFEKEVWVAKRVDIAKWWINNFPTS